MVNGISTPDDYKYPNCLAPHYGMVLLDGERSAQLTIKLLNCKQIVMFINLLLTWYY